jgi:hypothetical protein
MSEARERIIMVALPVEARIKELDQKQAEAVNGAIDSIGTVPGTRIDLPTADPAYPYYALLTSDPDAPVIIHRKTRPDEEGDWLVVSLMTPQQYRQQKEDERSGILADPAVRREIRVAAGTAATVAANTIAENITHGGAVPTTGTAGKSS